MFQPGTIFVAVILYIIFLFIKADKPHLANIPQSVVIAMCLAGASLLLFGKRGQSKFQNKEQPENFDTNGRKKDTMQSEELEKD